MKTTNVLFFCLLAMQLQAQSYYINIDSKTTCKSKDIHIIADSSKIISLQEFDAQIANNLEINANTKSIKIFIPTTSPVLTKATKRDSFDLSRCNFTTLKQLQKVEIYTCDVSRDYEYLPDCFFYGAPKLPPTVEKIKLDRFTEQTAFRDTCINPLLASFSNLPKLKHIECYTEFFSDTFLTQDIKIDTLTIPLGVFDGPAKNLNIRQLVLIDLTVKNPTYMFFPREEYFYSGSFAEALYSLPDCRATLVGGRATKKKYKAMKKKYPDLAPRLSWRKK